MIFRKNSGFTLIELLIVIALIGVLAVALLSTINPVEQTRKAKDSARKAAAAEMLNSLERFQATFFCYPWEITLTDPTPACGTGTAPGTLTEADIVADMSVNSSEMKPEFFTRDVVTSTGTNRLKLTEGATSQLIHICFVPESESFQAQADKNDAGVVTTGGTHVCVPE